MPIESPAPAAPALTAADSDATTALIADALVALSETAPKVVTLLASMYALVWLKTLLNATAPAPLTAPLNPALKATDREAAAAIASIVESETSALFVAVFPVRMYVGPPSVTSCQTVPAAAGVTPGSVPFSAVSLMFVGSAIEWLENAFLIVVS